MPRDNWRKGVEILPGHLFIIFHRQALINRDTVRREWADHVLNPVGSCMRLTPIGDAKADGLLINDLSIIVGPVSRIVLKHELVSVLIREVLLGPTRDFRSNQPIQHPKWIIGNLRHSNVGERLAHGGRVNIASPWKALTVSAVLPVSENQSDLRRSNPGLKLLLGDIRREAFEELGRISVDRRHLHSSGSHGRRLRTPRRDYVRHRMLQGPFAMGRIAQDPPNAMIYVMRCKNRYVACTTLCAGGGSTAFALTLCPQKQASRRLWARPALDHQLNL